MLSFGAFGLTFVAFERTVVGFGLTLGGIGAQIGIFWLHLGGLGGHLGAPWGHIGVSWAYFRGPWAPKTHPKWSRMTLAGHSKNIRKPTDFHGFEGLEAAKLAPELHLGCLGSMWEAFGAILKARGGTWEACGGAWEAPGDPGAEGTCPLGGNALVPGGLQTTKQDCK